MNYNYSVSLLQVVLITKSGHFDLANYYGDNVLMLTYIWDLAKAKCMTKSDLVNFFLCVSVV